MNKLKRAENFLKKEQYTEMSKKCLKKGTDGQSEVMIRYI